MSEEKIVFVGRMQNKTRDYIHNLEKENRELQQENQQLKEQLKDEENWRVKIAKENSSNVSECLKLIEQKKQYKSVLDEIREFIDNSTMLIYTKNPPRQLIGTDKLKEILDKVKE